MIFVGRDYSSAPLPGLSILAILVFAAGLFLLAVLGGLGLYLNQPPADFPTGKTITITAGTSARDITAMFAKEGVVKSATLLHFIILTQYDPTEIKAGDRRFEEPLTTIQVAKQLMEVSPIVDLIKITFPEGFRVSEYHRFTGDTLGDLSPMVSLELKAKEGKLFPDTYHIPPDFTHWQLIELMQTEAEQVLAEEYATAPATDLSQAEVIVLASIIEREANDEESMGLVSGILHNRLEIGMALQVDASVAYGLGKPGTELTTADLDIDGPYNTYTRAGLPEGPIAAPGRMAIRAALNPTPSEYLYYITGRDGDFYYAKTLVGHNQNVINHLR